MLAEIVEGDGQSVLRHARGQGFSQRAAIEAVQSLVDQPPEGVGQRGLAKAAAGNRRLAVDQKGFGKSRQRAELGKLAGGGAGLGFGDRDPVAGVADSVFQQTRQRQRLAAQGVRYPERFVPAADGPGDGQRGARAAVRYLPEVGIGLRRRPRARRAAGVYCYRLPLWRNDEPEAVAAEPVHMRINHGDGGRRGDHCFDCASAFAQYGKRALAGQVMGGDRHPTGGYMTVHSLSS